MSYIWLAFITMNRQFMSNVIRNFAEKIENGCFIKKLGGSERS